MARQSRKATIWLVTLAASALVLALIIGLTRKPLVGPGGPEAPPQRAPLDELARQWVFELLAPPVSDQPIEPAVLAERIARIGPTGLDVVIALSTGELAPPSIAAGTVFDPIHPEALARREEILREALARFDAGTRVERLEARSRGAALDVRLALLPLLAEVDHLAALPCIVELAQGIEPTQVELDYVGGTIERAVASQLARDPDAVGVLRRAMSDGDPTLGVLLVRAAARVHSLPTAGFVVDALGRSDVLDLEAMQSIGRMGQGGRLPMPPDTALFVQRYLSDSDPERRVAAIGALAALGEAFVVDELAALLESGDPATKRAAQQALVSITGTNRGKEREPWEAWIEEQLDWQARKLGRILGNLEDEDPGVAVGAIHALLERPLCRHEAAEAIAPLVWSPDADIASTALDALGALGSSRAVSILVAALGEDGDDPRRGRARDALVRLTGLDLPADAEVWRNAIAR